MPVTPRLRFEVLRRDGFRCRYCGAGAGTAALEADHVTPIALGGGDEMANLVTACEPCNSGKASTAPDAAVFAVAAPTSPPSPSALQKTVFGLIGEWAADDLVTPVDPDKAYHRVNALGIWVHNIWWRTGTDPEATAVEDFRVAVDRAVRARTPLPVLFGAARLAADADSTDVDAHARLLGEALTATLNSFA